jgi:hypothetical protein
MLAKEIMGGVAVAAASAGQSYYLWQVLKHQVRPHIFSRIIWTLLGFIACAAQVASDAGPGAWFTGIGSLWGFAITVAGFYHGEKSITRSDWACFIFSLSAIPVWLVTHNPLWAVVIVSAIDAVSYYPTIRKSWINPHQEGAVAFLSYTFPLTCSLFALNSFTLTTALYPATLLTMNVALVSMLVYRRKVLA